MYLQKVNYRGSQLLQNLQQLLLMADIEDDGHTVWRWFANDKWSKQYYLQMIIAVGFKVKNERAVQYRKWANGIVKDYAIKGWVMDDERLKNGGSVLTEEYYDRLLE